MKIVQVGTLKLQVKEKGTMHRGSVGGRGRQVVEAGDGMSGVSRRRDSGAARSRRRSSFFLIAGYMTYALSGRVDSRINLTEMDTTNHEKI